MPAETRELYVTMLRPEEAMELATLGQRLECLRKLTLMYGDVENVDFLAPFASIRALKCLLGRLKDFSGIGFCNQLTDLILGASLSSVGSLNFLQQLPGLRQLRLEGPHPSKGLDVINPMQSLRGLDLYAPKWSLNLLPRVCPEVEKLSISQGGYQSLDFITALERLTTLDIAYARKLTHFEGVGGHPHLHSLKVGHAIVGLRSCSQFGRSLTVQTIAVSSCKNLKDVTALGDWPALREVEFIQCPSIPAAQIDVLRTSGKKVNGK